MCHWTAGASVPCVTGLSQFMKVSAVLHCHLESKILHQQKSLTHMHHYNAKNILELGFSELGVVLS